MTERFFIVLLVLIVATWMCVVLNVAAELLAVAAVDAVVGAGACGTEWVGVGFHFLVIQ